MAGPHVDLAEVRIGFGVHADGAHETQRPVDLGGELVVAAAFGAGGDELLVPRVHAIESGESTLGECPQQVQRGR